MNCSTRELLFKNLRIYGKYIRQITSQMFYNKLSIILYKIIQNNIFGVGMQNIINNYCLILCNYCFIIVHHAKYILY